MPSSPSSPSSPLSPSAPSSPSVPSVLSPSDPAPAVTARPLDGGLVLRAAGPGDVEQIVALSIEAHGAREEAGVRWLLEAEQAGLDAWAVVADGEQVVAASVGLLPHFELGDLTVPVGQIEYVATAPEYRNRGLVRAIFTALERRAEAAGALVHLVEGIPYFYRVLGYGYGLGYAPLRRLPTAGPQPAPDGFVVRDATDADLPELRRLREADQARVDLRRPWVDEDWPALLRLGAATGEPVLVVEGPGRAIEAWTRVVNYEDFGDLLYEAAATGPEAAGALLAGVAARRGDEPRHAYATEASVMGAVVDQLGEPTTWFNVRYTKVPDPVALLRLLQPVLSRRLAASDHAGPDGELVLSLFHTSLVIRCRAGAVVEITTAPGLQDPQEEGGCGVAPDWLPALLLGRFPPAELERRVDDVLFDDHLPLVETLFPPLTQHLSWLV